MREILKPIIALVVFVVGIGWVGGFAQQNPAVTSYNGFLDEQTTTAANWFIVKNDLREGNPATLITPAKLATNAVTTYMNAVVTTWQIGRRDEAIKLLQALTPADCERLLTMPAIRDALSKLANIPVCGTMARIVGK